MRHNKSYLNIFFLVFIIIAVFACQTMAYSAMSSTFKITGKAYARVESDIRITGFRLSSTTSNITSYYEEFSKNTISTSISFLNNTSDKIVYDVEITNYGNVNMGIYDITGLPAGLTYNVVDYTLKDTLCDSNGKCNNVAKKVIKLEFASSTATEYEFTLNFEFRAMHSVTYKDITNNNYPTEVIDGGNLTITFKESLKNIAIMSNDTTLAFYKTISNDQSVNIDNILTDIEVINKRPAKLVFGDITEIGGEVCIKDECFYIISSTDTTVTLLAKYNLYLGNQCTGDSSRSCTAYGSKATGIQNSSMRGYNSLPYKGVLAFSRSNYWSSTRRYPSDVYNSSSSLYTHVQNYKSYLEGLNTTVTEARLLTYSEATNTNTFDCTYTDDEGTVYCSEDYPWLYTSSYWLGTAYDSEEIYCIYAYKDIWGIIEGDDYDYDYYNGIRPVITIDIDDVDVSSEVSPIRIIAGNYDTVGSQIQINDEYFYVISSTSDTVTMITKYNLYVGNQCTDDDSSTCTSYGKKATGLQDSNMLGYNSSPRKGVLKFASRNYWSSTRRYPSDIYNSNSNLYQHVENYKSYIEGAGVPVVEARLLTYSEATNTKTFDCNYEDEENGDFACSDEYPFIYLTSFWLGSAYDSSEIYSIYRNEETGYLDEDDYSADYYNGVRPVITISKSNF